MVTIEITITEDNEVLWRATNHNDIYLSGKRQYDARGERDTLLDTVRHAHYQFLMERR